MTVAVVFSIIPSTLLVASSDTTPDFGGLISEIAQTLSLDESDIKLWGALEVELSYNNETIQHLPGGSVSITFPIPGQMLEDWYDFYFIGVDVNDSDDGFDVGNIISGRNNYDGTATIIISDFPDAVIMIAVESDFKDIDFFTLFKGDIERLSGYENLASLADKSLELSAFFVGLDYNGVEIESLGDGTVSVTIPAESGFHYEFFGVGFNPAPSPDNNFQPLSTVIDEIPAIVNHAEGTVTVIFSEFADAVVMLAMPAFEIVFSVGGETTSAFTGRGGKLAELPKDPKKDNYKFDGWFTLASGGEKADLESAFTADTTVFAQFVIDSSVAEFMAAIGEVYPEIDIEDVAHFSALNVALFYGEDEIASIMGGGSVEISIPAVSVIGASDKQFHYYFIGVDYDDIEDDFDFFAVESEKRGSTVTFTLSSFYDAIVVFAVECGNPCTCDLCESCGLDTCTDCNPFTPCEPIGGGECKGEGQCGEPCDNTVPFTPCEPIGGGECKGEGLCGEPCDNTVPFTPCEPIGGGSCKGEGQCGEPCDNTVPFTPCEPIGGGSCKGEGQCGEPCDNTVP
ncbi:MAG: InlB B-repeat-containing protein, partial [Oscillospiraceae bacterium]|nr:InlB B-repeat-containing protein [Oscillospiraceae bacterium]